MIPALAIARLTVSRPKQSMFCVEITKRHPGDLGISVIVLARDPLEAVGKARRLYPEFVDKEEKNGRVYEAAHIEIDWDSGSTYIIRKDVRLRIRERVRP